MAIDRQVRSIQIFLHAITASASWPRNNSGVWNETGDTLEFSIAPAYYQTNWFRASCVAAFLALLWALYRLRLRQLARNSTCVWKSASSERTRIARDLHDTLLQSFQALLLRFRPASTCSRHVRLRPKSA